MSNPHRYFVEERADGSVAVKGQGKDRAARVVSAEPSADKLAHHFAGRGGVVEFKDTLGRFESCPCQRCKRNR
jgi:hypothetical protein